MKITSPLEALSIAALIVRQGAPKLEQPFASFPVVDTYQVVPKRAIVPWVKVVFFADSVRIIDGHGNCDSVGSAVWGASMEGDASR